MLWETPALRKVMTILSLTNSYVVYNMRLPINVVVFYFLISIYNLVSQIYWSIVYYLWFWMWQPCDRQTIQRVAYKFWMCLMPAYWTLRELFSIFMCFGIAKRRMLLDLLNLLLRSTLVWLFEIVLQLIWRMLLKLQFYSYKLTQNTVSHIGFWYNKLTRLFSQ